MIGLLFLFVVGLWIYFTVYLSQFVVRRLPEGRWRTWVRIIVVIAMIPLPIADEIIAGRQFKKLCEENSTIQVDRVKAVGKTVYLHSLPEIDLQGNAVPIALHQLRFVDVNTKEVVVSYNTLRASAGWIFRMLRMPEMNVPLTFESTCEPGGVVDDIKLFKELQITQIQRSELINKEEK